MPTLKLCSVQVQINGQEGAVSARSVRSNEKVTIKGERGEMKLSVLGPTRPETQVELSLTDARTVGVKAMIRESGDIEGTQGITIIGPAGSIEVSKGVIAAKRHIHMTPADAEKYGVTNGQIVSVKIDTDGPQPDLRRYGCPRF